MLCMIPPGKTPVVTAPAHGDDAVFEPPTTAPATVPTLIIVAGRTLRSGLTVALVVVILAIEEGVILRRARTALVPVMVVIDTIPPGMINLGVGPPALLTLPAVVVTLVMLLVGLALVSLVALALIPVVLATVGGTTGRKACPAPNMLVVLVTLDPVSGARSLPALAVIPATDAIVAGTAARSAIRAAEPIVVRDAIIAGVMACGPPVEAGASAIW
jgi:hypothetical protein